MGGIGELAGPRGDHSLFAPNPHALAAKLRYSLEHGFQQFIVEPEPSFHTDVIDQAWFAFISSVLPGKQDNHEAPAPQSTEHDERTRVTLCIPVRNRADMLYQAIASLAQQVRV